MKNLILFTLILCSKLLFSQASGSANFSLNINFEKNIPVDQLEIFCYSKNGNTIESVEIKIDKANNSVNIIGRNHFVIPVSFPTLYFSYVDKTKLNQHSKQETERKNIFYLVTGLGIRSYDENINQIIKFSKEKPNVLITSKNENGKMIYKVENLNSWDINTYQYLKENLNISNSALKLN
jgi:hypothetical protein